MPERRRHDRVPLHTSVWCEGEGFTLRLPALDVSEGGLFVRTASPQPVGTELTVSFQSGEQHVSVRAKVSWATGVQPDRPPGMGLSIVEIVEGEEAFHHLLRNAHARNRAISGQFVLDELDFEPGELEGED